MTPVLFISIFSFSCIRGLYQAFLFNLVFVYMRGWILSVHICLSSRNTTCPLYITYIKLYYEAGVSL